MIREPSLSEHLKKPWKQLTSMNSIERKKNLWGCMVLTTAEKPHFPGTSNWSLHQQQHNTTMPCSGSTSRPAMHDFWGVCLLQRVQHVLGLNFINFSFFPKPLTYTTIPKQKRKENLNQGCNNYYSTTTDTKICTYIYCRMHTQCSP